MVLSFVITDLDETYVLELRNGVANHRRTDAPAVGSTTLALARRSLIELFTGRLDFGEGLGDGRIVLDGDPTALGHTRVGDRQGRTQLSDRHAMTHR